jgi:hypothetical protein
MAGGSKRWRDFPDFQRFGLLQPHSGGRSSHGIFVPWRTTNHLGKWLEKRCC